MAAAIQQRPALASNLTRQQVALIHISDAASNAEAEAMIW